MKTILVALAALFSISANAQYFDRNLYDQQMAQKAAQEEQQQVMQTCKNLAARDGVQILEAKNRGLSAETVKANVVQKLSEDPTVTPSFISFMSAEIDEVYSVRSKDVNVVKGSLQLWCLRTLPLL